MRKVAGRARVQPAETVRRSQQLGLPGGNVLREIFVSRVSTRPEPLTTRARSLVKGGADNHLNRDLGHAQSHNLDFTLAQNEAF